MGYQKGQKLRRRVKSLNNSWLNEIIVTISADFGFCLAATKRENADDAWPSIFIKPEGAVF